MDDRRAGLIIRALRRRRGWRQSDLAAAAGLSQSVVSRVERGGLGHCSLSTVRQLLLALEARLEVDIRWRCGEVDRVADARHAALVAAVARVAAAAGWTVQQELTYSVYGERGSVDLVGLDRARRAVVAFEVKTELTSWEETQRRFDAKVRLLPAVLYERLGWRPTSVSQVIVFQESMTNRRRVALLGPGGQGCLPCGRTRGTTVDGCAGRVDQRRVVPITQPWPDW